MKKILQNLILYLSLLAAWEVLFLLRIWPEYIFPSPQGVLLTIMNGIFDNSFVLALATSMKRIFLGYGFSLAAGVAIGLVMGGSRVLDGTARPLFLGIGTLPSICWLPIGLLWFGLNEKAIFFIVIMGSFFSIAVAVDAGVKNIPPIYLKAASTMGARGFRRYLHVVLPAALPSIISGMKLGWTFAWRSLMAGEMLYVNLGLGHQLMIGRELNDINRIVAVMVMIVVIGILVDRFVFGSLEDSIRARWGLKTLSPSAE